MRRYLWGAVATGLGQVAFLYWKLWSPLGVGPAYTFLSILQYVGVAAGSVIILSLARAVRREMTGRRAIRGVAAVAISFSAAAVALLAAAMAFRMAQSPAEADLYAVGHTAVVLTWLTLVILGLTAMATPQRPVLPAVLLGLVFLAGTADAIALPYQLAGPSGEPDTSYLIRVEGGERHPERIYGLTVWGGPATLSGYLFALVSRSTVLVPASAAKPAMAQEDTTLELMLANSEEMAKAVGLQLLGRGKGVTPSGAGVVVTSITAGTPAATALEPGDLIVGLNGASVSTWTDLLEKLKAVRPGTEVAFSIRRDGAPKTLTLTTVPNPGDPSRGMVGFMGSDHVRYDIPVPITSNIPTDIGGPSMGLALTLQVIDQATPGGITNGWRVAATGAILPEGKVGAVGSVKYKVLGAERAGAGVLFVARENYEEALSAASKIQVVPVDSAQDALDWLKENAPLP